MTSPDICQLTSGSEAKPKASDLVAPASVADSTKAMSL